MKKFNFIILLICIMAGVILFSNDLSMGASMKPIQETNYQLMIQKGENIDKIGDKLVDASIIRSRRTFILYGKIFGKVQGIKYGLHTVSQDMSLRELYRELSTFRDLPVEKVKVVIPEGFNIRQIAKRLEEKNVVPEKEFLHAAREGDFDYWFLENIPYLQDQHFFRLEGFLFPATYEFNTYSSAEEVINTMLKRFEYAVAPYKENIEESPYSVFDIIRMASVIEREAKAENERARIAGVFYNRLALGMKLQSCATVQYLFNDQKAIITLEDLKIESPFNTYIYEGLPMGAISNPGDSSIKASVYPEKNDYLFFVAEGNTGQHKFARTFEEHENNIKRYRD